jgi:anti-sigma-K factor RskA
MSGDATDPPEDDVDILAGEFYLRLLKDEHLYRALALRHGGERRFNQAYRAWEARLMPLAEEVTPVAPPGRVWAAISAQTAVTRPSLWQNLNFWRYFGFGGGVLAAGLAVALLVTVLHPAPTPIATATLASKAQGIFVATAETAGTGTVLILTPSQVSIPPGKSAELWLIPPGAKPQPLGLLASNQPVTLHLGPAQSAAGLTQAMLAVSIEPPGGSPTGQPTGPVIAAAKFLSI